MARLILVWLFCFLCVSANETASARIRGGSAVIVNVCQPKGAGLNDLGGNPDDSAGCTLNASFQWADAFTNTSTGFRQSGQAAYSYNDATLHYNINCIDNGCGYNTATMTDDPANVSFSTSSGSITSGVLSVTDANLDATNGNIASGQALVGTGISTLSVPHTVSLISHIAGVQLWQLDQGSLTVAGTPAITGSRYPQLACVYNTSRVSISTTPIVFCQTTSDTTTASSFAHYNFNLHGGVWLRISASGTGVAGDVTVTDNNFDCNTSSTIGGVLTGVGTHFNFTITHNHFHGGNSAGCTTGGTILSNDTVGIGGTGGAACSTLYNLDIEWNVFEDSPSDNQAGIGTCINIKITNNAFRNFNLQGIAHGAVYANSLTGAQGSYNYSHNLCLYGASSPATLGTTCFSYLASAAVYTATSIQGAVTAVGNIAIANCSGGTCSGTPSGPNCGYTNYTVQSVLWQNVDPPYYGSLKSNGNLVDNTGSLGCGIYNGGLSRNADTCSQTANVSAHNTTITCTVKNDVWFPGSFVHVNTTPFKWCGTITYNGDNATGTMVIDTATSGCPSAPALAATNGIAGIKMPLGIAITVKNSATNFTVVNYNCSWTTSCAAGDLTAPHQGMYSACTLAPFNSIDPATGLQQTGTGLNTGTYVSECPQTDTAKATYHRYNPTIASLPATVNDGTDVNILTGNPVYMGGDTWGDLGVGP